VKARFVVRGMVQGVFFRATAREKARDLGITRIEVWNRTDGGFECVAEGDAAQLRSLEAWLHEGPPHARVESVERTDEG
jgi:acylphosphatase